MALTALLLQSTLHSLYTPHAPRVDKGSSHLPNRCEVRRENNGEKRVVFAFQETISHRETLLRELTEGRQMHACCEPTFNMSR